MTCLKINWFFYGTSRTLQLSEFVWTLRSSAWVVFNNFLLIDATDRRKISSDQKRLFFAVSLYPLSFLLPLSVVGVVTLFPCFFRIICQNKKTKDKSQNWKPNFYSTKNVVYFQHILNFIKNIMHYELCKTFFYLSIHNKG